MVIGENLSYDTTERDADDLPSERCSLENLYRPCVLGVIVDHRGMVLIGERASPRGAWQFPQGGIDPGESPEVAIQREMVEELGLTGVTIVKRAPISVRYDFPPGLGGHLAQAFRGQDQIWFYLQCPPGEMPDLNRAHDQEFVALEWVTPAEAMCRIVEFKKQAYAQGLRHLGLWGEG